MNNLIDLTYFGVISRIFDKCLEKLGMAEEERKSYVEKAKEKIMVEAFGRLELSVSDDESEVEVLKKIRELKLEGRFIELLFEEAQKLLHKFLETYTSRVDGATKTEVLDYTEEELKAVREKIKGSENI